LKLSGTEQVITNLECLKSSVREKCVESTSESEERFGLFSSEIFEKRFLRGATPCHANQRKRKRKRIRKRIRIRKRKRKRKRIRNR
jgi:hypothetical protein